MSTRKGTRGVLLSVVERRARESSSCLSCVKLYSSLLYHSLRFLRPFYTAEGCINRQRASDSDPWTGRGEIEHASPCVESGSCSHGTGNFPLNREALPPLPPTKRTVEMGDGREGCFQRKTRDILLGANWYVNERRRNIWKGLLLLCSRARHPFPTLRHLQHPRLPRLTGSSLKE